jgi:lipoprotein-releasing system ATP-binding protein
MGVLLVVDDIHKEFAHPNGTVGVLAGLSLALDAGSSLTVMGPSGSGKSTLLNIVGTLDRPSRGRIEFDGRDVLGLTAEGRARFRNRSVGFVFQDHHLLPQCTAVENVLVPCLAGGRAGAEQVARAGVLLGLVGLAGKERRFPGELSGGERQRVAVARALVNEPRLLLCDEPTGNLDAASAAAIGELFVAVRDARGVALLVATHNEALARSLGRTAHLRDGRLHE